MYALKKSNKTEVKKTSGGAFGCVRLPLGNPLGASKKNIWLLRLLLILKWPTCCLSLLRVVCLFATFCLRRCGLCPTDGLGSPSARFRVVRQFLLPRGCFGSPLHRGLWRGSLGFVSTLTCVLACCFFARRQIGLWRYGFNNLSSLNLFEGLDSEFRHWS